MPTDPRLRFEVVPDPGESPASANPQVNSQENKAATALAMIMLGLKTLSARTVVALAGLRTLAMVGSVFWLGMSLPNPNAYQLALLGVYAAFVTGIVLLTRGK